MMKKKIILVIMAVMENRIIINHNYSDSCNFQNKN